MSRAIALHDERWPFLFNSYYEGEGERHAARPARDDQPPEPRRGPRLARARSTRRWPRRCPTCRREALTLVELGIQHEQQHQELFLTDILATFAENPLEPAYGELAPAPCHRDRADVAGSPGREGLVEIGADGDGFAFDCERPRHRALLHPHAIANRCVTNGEWAEFIADGGYRDPALWLSEGWDWVQREGIERAALLARRRHALHARRPPRDRPRRAGRACQLLRGRRLRPLGRARLPTEAEWEDAFASADPRLGHQLDRAGAVLPRPGGGPFGDVWQWTQSAYPALPRLHARGGHGRRI